MGQHRATCLWGGGARWAAQCSSSNKLVDLHFPRVGEGPHQMNVQQLGSATGKAGFPVLLLKWAWSKQLRHTTLAGMKTTNPPPSSVGLAKYSAFYENEYFLSWRIGVRCHSGEGFLQFFFLHIFNRLFCKRSHCYSTADRHLKSWYQRFSPSRDLTWY